MPERKGGIAITKEKIFLKRWMAVLLLVMVTGLVMHHRQTARSVTYTVIAENTVWVHTTVAGTPGQVLEELSLKGNIIIICGHYKGIDYRIREHLITREVSIGDYVLTGGELAAAVMADAIVRVIPGVIGDVESALSDSFQDNLLEPPVYTRPAQYHPVANPEETWSVPDILLSGHEAKIREWEYEQAMERTKKLRPDLLE